MRRIIEDLFTEYVYTTEVKDLELYDLVAFLHPTKGYIIVARYFGCEENELIFHNITVPADRVDEFYILARPLHPREKKESLWKKATRQFKSVRARSKFKYSKEQ